MAKKLELEIERLKRQLAVVERLRFEAQKSKGRGREILGFDPRLFVSGVAHEFNNILGAIDGHVALALESDDPQEWKQALEITRAGTLRSHQVTKTLQGMFQPQEEAWQLIELFSVLQKCVSLFSGRAERMGVKWSVENPDWGEHVYLRPGLLEEIIGNLVHNGIDALLGSDSKELELEVRRTPKKILIRVRDSGPGVAAAFRDQIFRPFFTTKGVMSHYRGASDNRSTQGGSGLGLFWSKSLAEQAGGRLRLEKSLRGASFCLELPRVLRKSKVLTRRRKR